MHPCPVHQGDADALKGVGVRQVGHDHEQIVQPRLNCCGSGLGVALTAAAIIAVVVTRGWHLETRHHPSGLAWETLVSHE